MSHMFQGSYTYYSLNFSSFDFENVTNIYEIITDYSEGNIDSNLIELEFDISESDCNRKIYFLNKDKNKENEDLQNLNDSNTYLYINNEKHQYKNYFEPKYEGKYKIYLVFKNIIKDWSYMFANCKDIKKINLNAFKTEDNMNKMNMSHMFEGCEYLSKLDLSSFKTKNVCDMNSAFKNCKNLKDLNLSNFNTENVTDMSHMLEDCKNLTVLYISSFNTKNVNNMNSMFKNCENLKYLNLFNFNTEKVTDISHMFEGCENLIELDIPSFK